ncbi:MAG: ubiquinol-cytochrome c reductase iron-sulfur subunit [Candidatus Pedobacter colombiensis]|uniref:Ubiquinol-cytochrome c reductase iron-sulfur subunit n=1 Tax=Candidatus Pedobacter colombiensis TaxID=3121371 RepID=A0AAJ5WBJ1_9SPHI|nr:ubiquinol-cytochrome c reductase iron-sulfur subunit [Pedobacter sp.]WEK21576.1 MAG: ubiquinol-cytochrome c reductase iron-sulfur subunit [Pedobacter sp.]
MKENEIDKRRRGFLIKITLGLSALSAVVAGIPVLSAMLAPLMKKTPAIWRKVGLIDEFAIGITKLVKFENADPEAWAGMTAFTAAWLRRDTENVFTAFSVNCTHLGCPVRWEEGAELFMCPCHGGVYYKDGSVASGPPPKSLVQYQVRINKKAVEIQTAPVPITSINA